MCLKLLLFLVGALMNILPANSQCTPGSEPAKCFVAPPRSGSPTCCTDDTWTYLKETRKCHKVKPSYNRTWTGALQACQDEGGTLTSIHSDAENTALLNYANSSVITARPYDIILWVHIGLFNNHSSLQWTDGSSVEYAKAYVNWDSSGNPNVTPPPYCVQANVRATKEMSHYGHQWNTLGCNVAYRSDGLCEHTPLA
jgi:hypothetical protein